MTWREKTEIVCTGIVFACVLWAAITIVLLLDATLP